MRTPLDVLEVFLNPGDFYFGADRTRISTLLGSCVAITLWHPQKLLGGMCHFLLPAGPSRRPQGGLDGRYAEDAMQMFLREIRAAGTRPAEYRMKIFGGGSMNAGEAPSGPESIPLQNVAKGRELAARHGFRVEGADMGGTQHRYIMLDLWSGDVWVRRGPSSSRRR